MRDGAGRSHTKAGDAARSIQATTAVLCRKWKPVLLWLLQDGPRRWSELEAPLHDLTTHKVVSEQLQQLVDEGLVSVWRAESGRRHTEYALTPLGERLRPIVDQLYAWGDEYLGLHQGPHPTNLALPAAHDANVAGSRAEPPRHLHLDHSIATLPDPRSSPDAPCSAVGASALPLGQRDPNAAQQNAADRRTDRSAPVLRLKERSVSHVRGTTSLASHGATSFPDTAH